MKFLIDAQLPRRLAIQLAHAGFEVTHTLDLPRGNRTTDQQLINLSIAEQSVVVTKDSDFDRLADSFATFDFIELNRTSVICHL